MNVIQHCTRLGACLLVITPAALIAGPKDDQSDRLNELPALINQARSSQDINGLQDLTTEYNNLSAALGGDQAAESTGGSSAANNVLGAPAIPPNTVSSSASFMDSPGSAITTGAPVAAMINVTTADTYTWDIDLNVNITHTFASDLDITLTSPAGTTVTVTTDNGGGSDDVFAGTLFDDDAVDVSPQNIATDFTYTNLVAATPLGIEAALAAFVGEDPNGMWTLDIVDDAGGDDGVLVSWSLDVTTLDQTPMNTPAMGSNAPGATITTGAPVSDMINIAGAGSVLCDVNMTTNITHTFASDLDMTLTSPAGTVVTLSTDNGGGSDDVFNGTVWDDDAPMPVTDFPHANLTTSTPLVPEASMGAFIGEDPNGNWVLDIVDDAGGDDGILASWSLDINTCAGMMVPMDADLALVLTSNAVQPVNAGDQFDLTMTVTNNGPADATNVVVNTTLPMGTVFVSSACSGAVGNTITYNAGNILNGAMAACAATVQVNVPANLNFSGTVMGDQTDPTPANDTGVLALAGAARNVPTLGQWGLILMLASFGILGTVHARRIRIRS